MSSLLNRVLGVAVLAAASCAPVDVALLPGFADATVTDAGTADGGGPLPDAGEVEMDAGVTPIPGLRTLAIDPPFARLVYDGAGATTVVLHAIGTFDDDSTRDITAEVPWNLDDPVFGTIESGLFTSSGAGGRTFVNAAAGTTTARAELEVALDIVVRAPDAPAGIEGLFMTATSSDTVDTSSIAIIYPSQETMFPANIRGVRHQWRSAPALDLFQVSFDSVQARVRYYTAGRYFVPDEAQWGWLAHTHAGGSLTMTVRAASTTVPGRVWRSQTITLFYARAEVSGAAYYWSSGARSIMRATIDAPLAVRFLPADEECAACHTLSRDGRRIAFSYGDERLRIASVPAGDTLFPPITDPMRSERFGWGSFSPDSSRLAYTHRGSLYVLDVETGVRTGPVDIGLDNRAAHPDWAPDGSAIALAVREPEMGEKPEDMNNRDVEKTALARLPVLPDGSFGALEILAPSTREEGAYFPSYSPDSRWIAFARARESSRDNDRAELFLIRADGSGPVISMERLNRHVRELTAASRAGNTMPTWAPSSRPDSSWLAFSSIRDYGDVLSGVRRDQLWAAAIDFTRASAGDDPSYAAFWLPFQSTGEANHRAFWTLDPADQCMSSVDVCADGIDNDCSGTADDNCCTPAPESCGNAADEDCDGVADEGCGCAPAEICGNGLDDDCDGETDSDDSECHN